MKSNLEEKDNSNWNANHDDSQFSSINNGREQWVIDRSICWSGDDFSMMRYNENVHQNCGDANCQQQAPINEITSVKP